MVSAALSQSAEPQESGPAEDAATSSTKRAAKPERRQFSMGRESIERLDSLREMTDAASQSEVIRNALRTYQYLTQEEAAGSRILIEQKDGSYVRLKIL